MSKCYNSELPIGPPGPQGPPGTSSTITSTDGSIIINNTNPSAPDLSVNLGYQRISLNLTQISTNAPVLNVLINELDLELTSTYTSVGDYSIDLQSDILDQSKVQLITGSAINNAGIIKYNFIINAIDIQTLDFDFVTLKNEVLGNTSIEIRFYPGWDV